MTAKTPLARIGDARGHRRRRRLPVLRPVPLRHRPEPRDRRRHDAARLRRRRPPGAIPPPLGNPRRSAFSTVSPRANALSVADWWQNRAQSALDCSRNGLATPILPSNRSKEAGDAGFAEASTRVAGTAVLAIGLVASACDPAPPPEWNCPNGPPDAITSTIVTRVNLDRTQLARINALNWNSTLACNARGHAQYMANTGSFFHQNLDALIRDPLYVNYAASARTSSSGPAT